MKKDTSRFGHVTIVGAPNVGKSTLINGLVGQKVSIVTKKKQTTRYKVIGIFCNDISQVAIIDTPGIFKPKRRLDRAMVASTKDSLQNTDMALIMIEANKSFEVAEEDLKNFNIQKQIDKKEIFCVINKIDLVKKNFLLVLVKKLEIMFNFKDFFFVSALKGYGVNDLKNYLLKNVPTGPWHYPSDQITNVPYRFLAAEIVREKIMNLLHQELPYELTVQTEDWNDLDDGSIRIDIIVYVNKVGQKKILIGSDGKNLKKIGIYARKELQSMLNKNVHLFIFVKIQNNWDNNPDHYKNMDLKYDV